MDTLLDAGPPVEQQRTGPRNKVSSVASGRLAVLDTEAPLPPSHEDKVGALKDTPPNAAHAAPLRPAVALVVVAPRSQTAVDLSALMNAANNRLTAQKLRRQYVRPPLVASI